MDEWTTIRLLYQKGKPIREISRELKISRNTVRKTIRSNKIPKYNKTKLRKSVLDEYRKDIERMLYKDKFIGSRILYELRKMGYKNSDRTFYNYLNKIDGSKNLNKISMPYETEPAKQCQFDWAEYKVKIGTVEKKIYIFSVILGYSRKKKFTASLKMDQASVFESIEEAFKYFGGVPCQILMDNAKQMVEEANPSNFKWNEKFYSLCGFYNIIPKVCKIRTPKTKGKVERPFFYLENHFIKGNKFSSFSEIEEKLRDFTERVNNNYHHSIRTTPNNRFSEDEKDKLKSLPEDCFHGILEEMRKVSWDLLISYKGNRYSVPYHYAGKHVWVKVTKGAYIKIYSNHGKEIAYHSIPDGKGNVVKQEGHYSGISKDTPKSMAVLKEEFLKAFSSHEDFMNTLIVVKNRSASKHLRGLVGLRKYYSDDDIRLAMDKADLWKRYSYKIILSILRSSINSPPTADISNYYSKNVNDKLEGDYKSLIRNLSYYEDIS